MGRYTGPKWKISRRENADVFGSDKWKKRSFPPGMHKTSGGRPSNYAIQFREKQKVKRTYGLFEKQFRNVYKLAIQTEGNTGTIFLQLLEMRLDNVVYKLGLAKSRTQARQFVSHGHIVVNDQKINIPSYKVNIGDNIGYSPRFGKSEIAKVIKAETKMVKIPEWLSGFKVNAMPNREDIDSSIKEQLIIELYSR